MFYINFLACTIQFKLSKLTISSKSTCFCSFSGGPRWFAEAGQDGRTGHKGCRCCRWHLVVRMNILRRMIQSRMYKGWWRGSKYLLMRSLKTLLMMTNMWMSWMTWMVIPMSIIGLVILSLLIIISCCSYGFWTMWWSVVGSLMTYYLEQLH